MAVETTNAYSGPYATNGVTTTFPFTFSAMSADDVAVILRDADGVDTIATGYSVSLTGAAPSPGSVIFDVAPADGLELLPYLDPEFTQETEFEDGSAWLARPVNNANDRAVLRDQVLKRDLERAILAPIGESGVTLPSIAGRVGKFLAFDASGLPTVASGSGTDGALRTDLATEAGSDLIGTAGGETLQEALDAVQTELDTKVDSRPSPALNSLTTTTEVLYEDFLRLWWDSAANHFIHTDGSGSRNNGQPQPSNPKPAAWHMWSQVSVLYEHWKYTGSAADVTKVTQQWTYIKTKWTATQLRTDASANGISNISDDSCWHAKGLRMVHEMTGDANALTYLMDFIPAALERYKDPLQSQVSYGASPTGVLFKANPFGMLYAESGDATSIGTYGYISSVFEAIMADQALYVFRVDATKTNYLNYAVATYNWIYANLRRNGSTLSAAGIYITGFNLDPNVAAVSSSVVNRAGGLPRSGQDTAQVYHGGQDAYFGAPIRGLCAEYDGGTAAMGTLAYNLYIATGTASYLTEVNAICTGYRATNGFGRVYKGIPIFGQLRDAWTTGFSLSEFSRIALANPLVDTANGFRVSLRNTGKSILAQAYPEGRLTADWGGPEYNFLTGNRTWAAESADGYGGEVGGGLANPYQTMTHTSSLNALLAARYAVSPTVAYGSGAAEKPSVEDLAVDVAALAAALRGKADLSGANFDGPVGRNKNFQLGFNAANEPYYGFADSNLIGLSASGRLFFMIGGIVVLSIDGNGTIRTKSGTGLLAGVANPLA